MFLKRFIFVNWGGIPNQQFDMGPVNLLTGGNGSGKTTAADALQTIMTAAYDNLYSYNPGQEETSQRGRGGKQMRTLASYVLGCDDGSYARPWSCDGYIAAVFHPTKGESASPFTAIIGVRATVDGAGVARQARLIDSNFYIATQTELQLSDFYENHTDGEHIIQLTNLNKKLANAYGGDVIEKYDSKRAYLCRLYGALRGRADAVTKDEAFAAAKAFSGFMAYKPERRGIHQFVANEILEPKDQGEALRSVSSLMKNIHAMEAEAAKLNHRVDLLDRADQFGKAYIGHWVDEKTHGYIQAKSKYNQEQSVYVAAKDNQSKLRSEIAGNQKQQQVFDSRQRDIQQQIDELNARRMGVDVLRDKDQCELKQKDIVDDLGRLASELIQQDHQLRANITACDQLSKLMQQSSLALSIPAMTGGAVTENLLAVGQSKSLLDIDIHGLVARDWVGLDSLEQHLDLALEADGSHFALIKALHRDGADSKVGHTIRDQGQQLMIRRQQAVESKNQQYQRKVQQVDRLLAAQVSYPEYVVQALAAIQKYCPDADARVLCDYIEVTDERWQSAIEGYIGGNRFGIIVELGYEAEAIRIIRSLPGRRNNAKVIQGERVQADFQRLGKLNKNSIVHNMRFQHKIAEYYITASYSTVERVSDESALKKTRRGITQDGMASGNYAMFRCDINDADLVFGLGARERAVLALKNESATMLTELSGLDADYRQAKDLLVMLDSIKTHRYGEVVAELLDCQRQLNHVEVELANLDLSQCNDLEEQLSRVEEQRVEIRRQADTLLQQAGGLEERLSKLDKTLLQYDKNQESAELLADQCEQALESITSIWPDFDFNAVLDDAEQQAKDIDLAIIEQKLEQDTISLNQSLANIERSIGEQNSAAPPSEAVLFETDHSQSHGIQLFGRVVAMSKTLDEQKNRLKNNVLVEKFDQLTGIKASFNTTFVTNLCHAIYQAVRDGEQVLERLNSELLGHRFGADREYYQFDWKWLPEFEEYYRFFREIIEQPQLGDGVDLDQLQLSDKSRTVLQRLVDMLLAEDEQKAMNELARISDYRNYRQYEIYKNPEGKEPIALSQYGTGSGGQSETPFYIIRSAAVTSAFRFREGSNHLRMVLVDEAFSRMDETRSREVINYLTEQLGLQLIFVMPSSKAGAYMNILSNQFVFAKCPVANLSGELQTQVFVDRQRLNVEKIGELWAHHRRTIVHQASMDFMEEVLG
ncbi:Chromosome partition protein Smc [Sinobacterium norvegicum]|uniref:Chromosome partition protein Smc n=1 Tax=Sinobacterium norvegicum TaxID=1641715 RepID=A0ABM9ABS2_9GAMM|nr:SbcC/MukB-like Walker B domain-containing protein [Sinobacterium norvegicum]CAH0990646.1 Chromosome partition protein Smc [Sinobacterium norvegicum]